MLESGGGGGSSQGGLFTPPPDDPDAIRAAASQLKSHGTSVGDLAASARRTSTSLVGSGDWEGPSSDRFSSFSSKLSGLASDAEEPAGAIAGGANQYADALDTLKRKLSDAASRHQTATAHAENVRTTTNSNPNRTPAQVQAAQAEVDKADDEAKAAEEDARRAWAEYHHESEAAAKSIEATGSGLASGSKASSVTATLASADGGEGGEEDEGGPLHTVLEDIHHGVEDSEKGLSGFLEPLSKINKALDAQKAIDNPGLFSKAWNEAKSETWGEVGDWAEKWGKRAGVAGSVLGGVVKGWDQWQDDSHDPNLDTGDKVDRAATAGVLDAAGTWAGAEAGAEGGAAAGALIGSVFPGPGTAIGGAIGGAVGGIAGAWAGGHLGDKAADLLNNTFDGAGHAVGDAASAAGHAISGAWHDLTPW